MGDGELGMNPGDGFGSDLFPRPDVVCKYCKKDGLHWENVNGKWKTFEPDGTMHKCKKGK